MEFHLTATECHFHTGSHSVTCHPTQANTPHQTPAKQAVTRFTYPGGMEVEDWVDLVDLKVPRPGVEPATFRSQVWAQPLHHQDMKIFGRWMYKWMLTLAWQTDEMQVDNPLYMEPSLTSSSTHTVSNQLQNDHSTWTTRDDSLMSITRHATPTRPYTRCHGLLKIVIGSS